MMMEGKKLKSLLKFYKKKDVRVELQINLKKGFIVKGNIIKLNCVFGKFLVLRAKDSPPVKIFFDEIVEGSIVPADLSGEPVEKKKDKESRSPLPPKLRFDVFRRDKYVCQYCGACPKKAELEVDHVVPVSRGGTDDLNNLKTSCFECNRGKGGTV